jgi:zinc protease
MKRFMELLLAVTAVLWLHPAAALTIEKVVSPGGIEAWLVEDHSNPIISAELSFAAGGVYDPAGKEGLAGMVASLLDEGAGDLDSQAFQARLDDLAVTLSFAADSDNFTAHLKTLTENRDEAFQLLRLALTAPRFDPEAVQRVRAQTLSALQQEEQDPQAVLGRAFAALIFPGHPYGRSPTQDSVKAIAPDDLKSWVPAHLSREKLVIGVAGDITPAELGRLLDRIALDLPAHLDLPDIAEIAAPSHGQTRILRRPIPQSTVSFGEQGLKRDDPDWYAAYVMNYILGGGGFASRLMTEVRVKRGLAYGVHTALAPRRHAALLEGDVATRNDRLGESLAVIRQEWRHLAEGGVTAEELRAAKTYLNGAFPLQMSSTAAIAGLLVLVQRDHLGIDYFDRRAGLIDRVSAEDIRRVARRLLDPEALTVMVVGDPQGMAE